MKDKNNTCIGSHSRAQHKNRIGDPLHLNPLQEDSVTDQCIELYLIDHETQPGGCQLLALHALPLQQLHTGLITHIYADVCSMQQSGCSNPNLKRMNYHTTFNHHCRKIAVHFDLVHWPHILLMHRTIHRTLFMFFLCAVFWHMAQKYI